MAEAAVLERLEAVTARLERVARKMGGGGGDDAAGGAPEYVGQWDAMMGAEFKKVMETSAAINLPDFPPVFEKGFNAVGSLIKKLPECKKPGQKALQDFLAPLSAAIKEADNLKYRGKDFKKFGDHYKAAFELVNQLMWVVIAPPMGTTKGHCDASIDAIAFNLNRVIKNDKSDETKAWNIAMRALAKKQMEYVVEFFKTGLEWNPNGGELSGAASTTATASTASSAKKPAAKKAADNAGAGAGMAGVFGELSKGLKVTSGLKKVDDSKKTKYRKDRSGKVSTGPAKKSGKPKRQKGPPSLAYKGGRWMVENYFETDLVEVDKADVKSNVYVAVCDLTCIVIKGKVKSVAIDSCIKCKIYVDEVISTVEMVNCKGCTVYIQKKAPTLSIEKCESPRIWLSHEAYQCAPDIYTSNVSAMNIETAGKGEKDDTKEYPVPEQFLTKIDPKTGQITTKEVEHA